MTRDRAIFASAVATVVITHLLSLFFAAAETVELFVQVLVAVVALVLVYLALSVHIDKLTQSVSDVRVYVRSHLSAPLYETDAHRVANHLEEVVTSANEFVYAVGGRARDIDYLDAIADKMRAGKEHIRIISGDHVLHPLHEHLQQLLDMYDPEDPDSEFRLGWYPDERFGHFTVSDTDVLISTSNPLPRTPLQSVLRISDPALSQRYKDYVQRLYSTSTRIGRASPVLSNLCRECSRVTTEVDDLREKIKMIIQGVAS